jgi:hypothetical protein
MKSKFQTHSTDAKIAIYKEEILQIENHICEKKEELKSLPGEVYHMTFEPG